MKANEWDELRIRRGHRVTQEIIFTDEHLDHVYPTGMKEER